MLDTTHEMNAIIDQKHSIVINLLNTDYGRGQSTKREKWEQTLWRKTEST